jgi:hypothetical protein
MIMASSPAVNHDKIIPDGVSAFAADQIWGGMRPGDFKDVSKLVRTPFELVVFKLKVFRV